MDVEMPPGAQAYHFSNASSHKPPRPPPRRRRRCVIFSLCCLSTLIVLALVIVILAFTVFKRRDPTITVSSITIQGVSPSITFPPSISSLQLNLTLLIGARVYNPNHVSFSHAPGTVHIFYRGTQIGDADVGRGKVPSRGTEGVQTNVTLTLQSFVRGNLTAELLGDVVAGELGMDTKARVPGRITLLGFIKKHLVAISDCHFTVGFPSLDVKQQECSQKAKL